MFEWRTDPIGELIDVDLMRDVSAFVEFIMRFNELNCFQEIEFSLLFLFGTVFSIKFQLKIELKLGIILWIEWKYLKFFPLCVQLCDSNSRRIFWDSFVMIFGGKD